MRFEKGLDGDVVACVCFGDGVRCDGQVPAPNLDKKRFIKEKLSMQLSMLMSVTACDH